MTKKDSERKKKYTNSKKKYTTISEEVKRRMKKESPESFSLLKGLSPVTHLRKYLHKKQIKKELASRPEHLSPAKVRGN